MDSFIPVAEPSFNGNELKYLTNCIKSGWISSIGEYVSQFEEGFAEYVGCKYAVAVHTGTAALHLALIALGIGEGDEVIVPTLTFAATANCVIYTGAKPVVVDVDSETWNIDPSSIQKAVTQKTKAIIPVHLYGHPCEMNRIMEIAEDHKLYVVEDAAEAHGAEYNRQRVGGMGDIGCFSFFGNKIITTGEGGLCVTNDKGLIEKIAKFRDHGMSRERKYWHDAVGYNYRMTNMQAAVGKAQLERIDYFVKRKKEIAALYNELLSDTDPIRLPVEKDYAKSAFWMYSILIKESDTKVTRDMLADHLKQKGIDSRPVFYPLHLMPPYKQTGSFPNAEFISKSGLSLPSSANLTNDQITYICHTIKEYFRK